jgi:hypothetical protein
MVSNIHALPNKECDKIQVAMDQLLRMMPKIAPVALAMREEFVKAGFTEDEALKLVAYAVFK